MHTLLGPPHNKIPPKNVIESNHKFSIVSAYEIWHRYDILGARMLWKPKEARILKNFIEF
jgi:hypothetical protein